MREHLIEAFEYDLWANLRWLPLAGGALGDIGLARGVPNHHTDPALRLSASFAHILRGQRLWLEQMGIGVQAEGEDWVYALNEKWRGLMVDGDLSEPIRYRDWNDQPRERTLGQIAWHATNHGTYHRGQMREIAESSGMAWPETDVTIWYAEKDG